MTAFFLILISYTHLEPIFSNYVNKRIVTMYPTYYDILLCDSRKNTRESPSELIMLIVHPKIQFQSKKWIFTLQYIQYIIKNSKECTEFNPESWKALCRNQLICKLPAIECIISANTTWQYNYEVTHLVWWGRFGGGSRDSAHQSLEGD